MLAEARAIGEELGDTEIQAEAMAWTVAGAGRRSASIETARRGARRAARDSRRSPRSPSSCTWPSTTRAAIALGDGRLDEAEAAATRSDEPEPAADGPRRVGRLRHPDVQPAPRAGPAGRTRAGNQGARRGRAARRGAWRPGRGGAARRARDGDRGEARARRGSRADGLEPLARSRSGSPRSRTSPTPCAALRDDGRWPRSSTRSSRRGAART